MAIRLNATYSKRLGLPGYSSHQFSVSVETELVATDDVAAESRRLYDLLQTNVDEQIQSTGFVPPGDYGMDDAQPHTDGSNGHSPNGDRWQCSDKQKELILKLVDEHSLDKDEVDHLARQRFGKGVKQLNKMEASGLIDELLDTHGGKPQRRSSGRAYANGKGGHS
ncbi:hypothetical protein [Haloferula sp. A504]|uniref:hypothetical protein n=1 Tax=Haloferula sp. A504 TaxID=3373601 RepID=UPI0031C3523F|nr:hypothetical protein [Verrucomicrobiaceae bacterium E54]